MTLGSPPPPDGASAPDDTPASGENATQLPQAPLYSDSQASMQAGAPTQTGASAESHAGEIGAHAVRPERLGTDVPGAHPVVTASETGQELPSIEYEDDETSGTLFLRAVFTLVAGAFLLWAQWSSGVNAAEQWGTWVKGAVLANLVLPLGVIWLFFGQGLRTADWMREMKRDPRYNAWNYGWNPRPFKRHFGFAVACLVVMLPFLWYFSRDLNTRLSYQQAFLPPTQTPESLVRVLVGITIYMLCWEWFFRGFLLFGIAQGLGKYGWIPAIVLQSVLFYFAHSGKPLPEMYSSFGGGLLLGAVCWREKSFFPAFYTHLLIQVAWVLLMR